MLCSMYFIYAWIVLHCMNIYFVYPVISWWVFGMFLPLGVIKNSTSVDICVQAFGDTFKNYFEYIQMNVIAVLYININSLFHFLRNLQTVLNNDCPILHSISSVWRVQVIHILANAWYFLCCCDCDYDGHPGGCKFL